jgi:hypothetical protein
MTKPEQNLDDLLNDIEQNCDPAVGDQESNDFMFDCLLLVQHKLPAICLEAMALLTAYRLGQIPLHDIDEMAVRCWRYLDENYKGADSALAEVSAVRAVIFPLNAHRHVHKGEHDIVDYLSSFLTFVNQIEPHLDEEESLLRKHFARCI